LYKRNRKISDSTGGEDPDSNVVDAYIKLLRKKLGSDLIETVVRGIGYRLRS
jgi:DNA-binding response OmpR family regulator